MGDYLLLYVAIALTVNVGIGYRTLRILRILLASMTEVEINTTVANMGKGLEQTGKVRAMKSNPD